MLHKKGDPHSAVNYRPISLLTSCYKLIAKWLLADLDGLSIKHKLVYPCHMGGLQCRRTADHSFPVLQALKVHLNSYHLQIDFDKAFNSMVCPTLWCLLEHYSLPTELINCPQLLYCDTLDGPPPLPEGVSRKQKPSKPKAHPPSDPPLQPMGKRQHLLKPQCTACRSRGERPTRKKPPSTKTHRISFYFLPLPNNIAVPPHSSDDPPPPSTDPLPIQSPKVHYLTLIHTARRFNPYLAIYTQTQH